ncbi:MAG: hypothetical protein CM15mP23_01210 [Cryomorphaceae bacterium]|nr:MAG: hypothetical protein CM15mP23_01210 [Cryomorphaceae bacterium]
MGDDAITDPIDGLLEGQVPTFAILTNQNYVIAFEAVPDFEGYIANSFLTFTEINFDLTIYGCTDQLSVTIIQMQKKMMDHVKELLDVQMIIMLNSVLMLPVNLKGRVKQLGKKHTTN